MVVTLIMEACMRRVIARAALVIGLVGVGWSIGRAQIPEPDFQILVDAPGGETAVHCVRGCNLQFHMDAGNPRNTPQEAFSFACNGGTPRCSAKINGFLRR